MNKNVADYVNFQNNRAMTRVMHPPGGGSSLSLGWDPQPIKNKLQRRAQNNNTNLKHNKSYIDDRINVFDSYQPQKFSNNSFINNANQSMNQQYDYNNNHIKKNYFQPSMQSYFSMQQSTRLLQEELKFYQEKNKLLRQKVFGGYPNDQQLNRFTQFKPKKRQSNYQQQQQLDRALKERMAKYTLNHNSRVWETNSNVSMMQQNSPRTSVKVHNPPGGRSSIRLG